MSDKRRNLVLLKILGQIQQDNEDARDGMEKSIGTVCNEEGISFGQVFIYIYIYIYLMLYLLSFFCF